MVSVEQNEDEELQVYPNPVSHISTYPSKKTLFDTSPLPKGMYYVVNDDKSIRLMKR